MLSVDTCMVTPFEKMGWLAKVGNDIAFPSVWQEKYWHTELVLLQPTERIVAVVRPAFALARALRRPSAPGQQRQWEAPQDFILPIDPQPLATEELIFVTIVPRAIIAASEADGGRIAVECRAGIVDGRDDDIRPFTLIITAPKTAPRLSAFLNVSETRNVAVARFELEFPEMRLPGRDDSPTAIDHHQLRRRFDDDNGKCASLKHDLVEMRGLYFPAGFGLLKACGSPLTIAARAWTAVVDTFGTGPRKRCDQQKRQQANQT